ncbi:MAG: S8 family peptidase [Bacteroidetes bacterium]|nr:S8 family peptidase [Bacteroidota bacterium]
MKLFFYLLAALVLSGFAAIAQPHLSPRTKIYLQEAARYEGGIMPGYVYKSIAGQRYLSALIQVQPGFSDEPLKSLGVLIGTKAGRVWTAQIPLASLPQFIKTSGIGYIQLDQPVQVSLDSARHYSHVDSVQQGLGLSQSFLGKGVVVGIIDAGFDYSSPALWDTGGHYYRVKRVWAQKDQSATAPIGFFYGSEYADSTALMTAGTDKADMSHGTHVTGIAAGSGFGSSASNNRQFRGIAPLSDIVLVGIMPAQQQWINSGGSDVIDGMSYIFHYAASVGKPCVINLSWGTSLGAHDGSSLFSEAVESLCGPGKLFVNSAGNAGAVKGHVQKGFSPTDTLLNTFVTYNASVKKTWVDIWGDSSKYFRVGLRLYQGNTAGDSTGFVPYDGSLRSFTLVGSDGDTCFISIAADSIEYNGKPRAFISVFSNTSDSICVQVLAKKGGTVNLWNRYVDAPTGYEEPFTNGGKSWAVGGDTLQSISDNASGPSVITVGAYATKTSWRTQGGAVYGYTSNTPLGAIAPFSSTGPTSDSRIKPDITGPGYGVVSSVNSYDPAFNPGGSSYNSSVVSSYLNPANGRTYRYAILAGTSMSGPVVAGVVALLLEANPSLNPAQAINVLKQTAIVDAFTGTVPNNTWGGGKVNAYAALKLVLQQNSVAPVSAKTLPAGIYPNPGDGQFQISLMLDAPTQIRLEIFELSGRRVHSENWQAEAGFSTHALTLNHVAAGVYIARLSSSSGSSSSLRFVLK